MFQICKAYYNPTKDSDGDSGTVELDPTKVSRECSVFIRYAF